MVQYRVHEISGGQYGVRDTCSSELPRIHLNIQSESTFSSSLSRSCDLQYLLRVAVSRAWRFHLDAVLDRTATALREAHHRSSMATRMLRP